MLISGILGTFSFVILPEMQTDENNLFYILGAAGAGFFTTLGIFALMRALPYGSAEVAALFTNMRVVVQMLEEFLIFQIIPSVFSLSGVIFALIGGAIMIIFEHRESHYKDGDLKKVQDTILSEEC
jgi:drug/metabolite transporter (DMT)-like permease